MISAIRRQRGRRKGQIRVVGPVLFMLLSLLCAAASAAGLSAEVDRSRLAAEQTLRLTIVADGALSGEPDLGALEQDFDIVGRSSGTSTSIVNGQVSQERQWILELSPRRTGDLKIPALSLGGEHTAEIPIQVVSGGSQSADSGAKALFLDTEIDIDSPYVQQGFVYRVKVMFREQPRGPTLSEPAADGAQIEQLGDDQSYTEMVDGLRYQVIERRYLVIPQRSGPLKIQSPRLDARLPDNRPGARRGRFAELEELMGGRLFQGFPDIGGIGGGRRVIERGPDQEVQVRAQPADAPSPWLPAESIELTDEWAPTPPRFRVGEPVTRTITITARGLTSAQLPTLDIGEPTGANAYADAPKVEDLPGDTPVSLKSLKVALVPTHAGALTLPEIRLDWWDTGTDRPRVAVIPERTVQVVAAAPGAGGASRVQQRAVATASAVGVSGADAASALAGRSSGESAGDPLPESASDERLPGGNWPWLVALAMGLGWIATLVLLVIERRRGRDKGARAGPDSSPVRPASLQKARQALDSACASADPRAARSALMDWGRARWGRAAPAGLAGLAARLGGDEVRACLDGIDRAIYAPGDGSWDGQAAGRLLRGVLNAAAPDKTSPRAEALPALYPRGI